MTLLAKRYATALFTLARDKARATDAGRVRPRRVAR